MMSVQKIIDAVKQLSVEERREVAVQLAKLNEFPAVAMGEPKLNVWDVLLQYAGTIDCLPEDMSVNHDHYLYGSPKQQP